MDIKLNIPQTKFTQALLGEDLKLSDNKYTEFAYFGGFGSGKSFITTFLTLLLVGVIYPNTPWLFVRMTYGELKDSVIPQFLRNFPPEKFHYRYLKNDRRFIFENGSVIDFRAFDVDTKILSNEYAGATVCQAEQIPFELYLQIIGRIRNKSIPKNITILEGNPGVGWTKMRFKDNGHPDHVFFVEAKTSDNQDNLPDNYEQRMRSEYPENWINRYIDGNWENLDELVLSEFRDRHIVEPISEETIKKLGEYKHAAGGDYGYLNASAFVWGYKDYDGRIIIYDEFYKSYQTIPDLAEAGKRHGQLMIPYDFATKRPDRDGKSVWDDLILNGLNLIPSNKDKMRNISAVNTLFKRNNIFITRNCVNLIREIKNWKWLPEKIGDRHNRNEKPVDKDDHAIDAMLYLISYLEDLSSVDPSLIDYIKTIEGQTQIPDMKKNTTKYLS